jgi:hypothetical protein
MLAAGGGGNHKVRARHRRWDRTTSATSISEPQLSAAVATPRKSTPVCRHSERVAHASRNGHDKGGHVDGNGRERTFNRKFDRTPQLTVLVTAPGKTAAVCSDGQRVVPAARHRGNSRLTKGRDAKRRQVHTGKPQALVTRSRAQLPFIVAATHEERASRCQYRRVLPAARHSHWHVARWEHVRVDEHGRGGVVQ